MTAFQLATLVLPIRDDEVLLGLKSSSAPVGAGTWNGAGGKVERHETIRRGACRELREEFGITALPAALLPSAEVFTFAGGDPLFHIHTFLSSDWEGVPKCGEKVEELKWFSFNAVPLERMMEADREWLPQVLAGERLVAHIYFAAPADGAEVGAPGTRLDDVRIISRFQRRTA